MRNLLTKKWLTKLKSIFRSDSSKQLFSYLWRQIRRDYQMINICNVQRLLLPPGVYAVKIYILSLVHQLRLLLILTFVSLPIYLVSWYAYSIRKSLFTCRLRIALVFLILTIARFISESLLDNTIVTMAIIQKFLGTFSS